jgi:rhodanese-related sulfurtransferase
MIDTNPQLIVVDVRELYEYCSGTAVPPGHIPGGLNYPWNSGVLQSRYSELPVNADILVYCGMSIRSPQAAAFLCTRGYASVYNMNPGFTSWPYETAGCVDTDGDGINDDLDTCTDTDDDGFGDPGFPANTCRRDNCPSVANAGQADGDADCIGDVCDPEPYQFDPLTIDSYPPGGNGCGDLCECEGNFDDNATVDGFDAATLKADYGRSLINRPCTNADPCNGDFNCNGNVDGLDAALFKPDFGRSGIYNPCPSCPTDPWCTYP